MSWKSAHRRFHSLRFRLGIWHFGLLAATTIAVFAAVFLSLRTMLTAHLDEQLVAEAEEWDRIFEIGGLPAMRIEFESEIFSYGGKHVFCRLFGPDSTTLLTSDLTAWGSVPEPPRTFIASGAAGARGAVLESLRLPGRESDVRTVYYKNASGHLFQFARSRQAIDDLMERFRWFAIAGALVLILAGSTFWYWLAKRSLAGLNSVTEGVRHVTLGDLTRRIEGINTGDEIEELARAFNHMQDRVQDLVGELRNVSINVAHDLRTPLTRIRGVAEACLTGDHESGETSEALAVVVEESDRLMEVINTMLTISEAESGLVDYAATTADLTSIVGRAVELFQPVAEDKGLTLDAVLPEGPTRIPGESSRIERVVANLIDNAIKFTPPGGQVTVRLFAQDDRVVIDVRDTGIGIPEGEIPKVFQRFYRGDAQRTSAGSGLGLAYVASIVRAHGGEVSVKSTLGQQTVVTVSFGKARTDPIPTPE